MYRLDHGTVAVHEPIEDNPDTGALVCLDRVHLEECGDFGYHGRFGPGNPWCEFSVSSSHESIKATHHSIREDLEDRWFTKLNDDRINFFLIASLLDLS